MLVEELKRLSLDDARQWHRFIRNLLKLFRVEKKVKNVEKRRSLLKNIDEMASELSKHNSETLPTSFCARLILRASVSTKVLKLRLGRQ